MQDKNEHGSRRRSGRRKKPDLTPREQARLRKRRQRARQANEAVSKIEVFVPEDLKGALKKAADGKNLSEIGQEAFRLWLETRKR